MIFNNVAAFAAISALADAFLIPPQISKADIDVVDTLSFEAAAEGISKVVDLKCSGCPVPALNLDGSSIQHVDSTLEIKLAVEQDSNNDDRLSFNGVSIFPPNMASIEPFQASQKFSEDQPFETQENVRLGYEMSMRPIQEDANGLELIAINVHIFEVADKFVDGIDTLELQLIKTPHGKLMIASVDKKPSSSTPLGLIAGDKDCTSMLCKWRAIVAAKLAHLKPIVKGCMGKIKGGKASAMSPGNMGHGRHGGRPHHKGQGMHKGGHHQGGHHEGGHRHHRHRGLARFMHVLRSVTLHVLVPIFIGIAAGLTASVVGMVIGHLIVLAWRSIRGGSPAYSRLGQTEILDDEKILIIEPQGPPPVYEDVGEEVTDEKN